ncbi:metallophosphoesterase [Paenibacillus sp. S150]|uniref:metallophosphoesterase family protein n=1 Tax=Paenibacillus sp. S150 TaxID=2749826 RepID=UPI001C56D891|nr:metallophosphoesterase [Paenibacillus sp. S150]MBW4082767.1 metallophosphoesterase [Paenibacillus sp. S150]
MNTIKLSGQEPLLTFQVITDTHITADPAHEYNLNFERVLRDLAANAQGSSGIMHVGDITDHGFPDEYEEVRRILQMHEASLPEIRYTLGNHDVGLGPWQSRLAEVGLGDWEARLGMYTSHTGMPGPYHDRWIGGYHFIFLGTEEGLPAFCSLSDGQLRWLDRKLGEQTENELELGERLLSSMELGGPMQTGRELGEQKENGQASGAAVTPEQPIFLFLHQPLKDTVAGSLESQEWYGVTQDKELRAILSKYPQALLFTGHTHWELEADNTMYPGNGETATMFNAASVAYLWTNADEHKAGSQGYYVEVYPDKVLVRGRDFTTGRWIESAQYEVAAAINVRS